MLMNNDKNENTYLQEGLYSFLKGFYSAASNILGHFWMQMETSLKMLMDAEAT